jgi:hypothetical protein
MEGINTDLFFEFSGMPKMPRNKDIVYLASVGEGARNLCRGWIKRHISTNI